MNKTAGGLRHFWRGTVYALLIMVFCGSSVAAAQTDIYKNLQFPFYDPSSSVDCSASSASMDRFLQVLARHESGTEDGDYKAYNPAGAYGRYQYIHDTWRGLVGEGHIYPPGGPFNNATDADPPGIQDTVAYIEYGLKAVDFKGDIVKMAISHYYPLALTDQSWLDKVPHPEAGNALTVRQYAKFIADGITGSVGSAVQLNYSTTPDFQKYLTEALQRKNVTSISPLIIDQSELIPGNPLNDNPTGGAVGSTCACTPGGNGDGKTIVLDPGHVKGSTPASERDPTTGLYVQDYDNSTQERHNAYQASLKIADKLKSAGFNIINTKSSENDSFNLGERAQKINTANPILAITLHGNDDHFRLMWYPDENSVRVPGDGPRVDGKNGLAHPEIAGPTKDYAQKLAPIINQEAGLDSYKALPHNGNPFTADSVFGNKLNKGNTPVQTILSSVPEIYSEVDNNVLGTDKFADAVADAIIKTVKPAASQTNGTSNCNVSGNLAQTIVSYAWPTKHDPEYVPKQEYENAIDKAKASGETYFGGSGGPNNEYEGIDCGAFIIRLMHDSGADKNYPQGNTIAEMDYLEANSGADGKYQKIGVDPGPSALQFGDIGIKDSHVYMFVGTVLSGSGFSGNAVSASLRTDDVEVYPYGKAPAGSGYYPSGFTWYRFKGSVQ